MRKDGVLVPRQRWLFDRMFAEGQEYTIEIHEPRSTKSHNHFHAVVNEAWKNLPEEIAKQHPDADHLRKFALIKTGWSIKRNVVCESIETAHAFAAIAGQLNESAVIVVQGPVVTIAVARSQKTTGTGAMNREEFQKSKSDVLDYVASLIGVSSATLTSQVPNSSAGGSSSDDNQAAQADRTDKPVAASGPQPSVATGTNSEASLLSPDWRDVYIQNLSGIRDKPTSLLKRHADAIQMVGGEPNESELAWMRKVWRLVHQRNEGKLKRGEYDIKIEQLRTAPLEAATAA